MNTDQTGSWTLPDEYVMLGDTVRRFMEREVRPVEERLEHDATNLPTNELTRLQGMAREMSVWCNQSPSEYGGGGLNLLGQCVSGVDNGALGHPVCAHWCRWRPSRYYGFHHCSETAWYEPREDWTHACVPAVRDSFRELRDSCRGPLGEEGAGFSIAEEWLVHARVPYAAASIGVAQAALDLAIEWAKQRKTFGSLLSDKQAIQWMIADSEMDLQASRLLVYRAAWHGDLGRDIKIDASIAKVFATEAAGRVVDRRTQVFGAMGMTHELPLERWYRELRIRRGARALRNFSAW